MTYIPNEILWLVCNQLWHQRDFNTLFNCACSCSRLASIAVMDLYRIQHVVPDTNGGSSKGAESGSDNDSESSSDGEIPARGRLRGINHDRTGRPAQRRFIMKHAGLWRSMLLSTLGKTLYPYCQHIRILNLRDLKKLLTDRNFGSRISKYFYQDDLSWFKNHAQLARSIGISSIAEAIMEHTPRLEKLIGEMLIEQLTRWIPRLSRLTHLVTWSSVVVREIGTLVQLHCPSFKGLDLSQFGSLYLINGNANWRGPILASFLDELRPQSIASFKLPGFFNLGPEIFQAINCHGESLTELKLVMDHCSALPNLTIYNLSLLNGCTNLVSLSLAGCKLSNIDLEVSGHNAFRNMCTWLKKCKKLRNLALSGFFQPAWITLILLEDSIHLTSLKYQSFELQDQDFHRALTNQTSLQNLSLKGIIDGFVETDVMVECLSKLVNLTKLRLEMMSEFFVDRHIVQLAGSLPKLKCWSKHGCRLTDAIWDEVASLRSLQRLELRSMTRFTADGIFEFIEKLGPGNGGLVLSVRHVGWLGNLSTWVEPEPINEMIAQKVQGRFEVLTGQPQPPTGDIRRWENQRKPYGYES